MPDSVGVLKVMDTLKDSRGQLVRVADEYGTNQGIITPIDILEAIAGEFPDEDELPVVQIQGPGRWKVDGTADLHYLQQVLPTDALVSDADEFTSLAGRLPERYTTLPMADEFVEIDELRFELLEVVERRIATVLINYVSSTPEDAVK